MFSYRACSILELREVDGELLDSRLCIESLLQIGRILESVEDLRELGVFGRIEVLQRMDRIALGEEQLMSVEAMEQV